MMYGIEVSAILIITLFMAHFGADALAAHQIARQYFSFFLMILFGMSGATTVRVGYAVGSNNKPAISRSTYTDIGIALFLTSIVAVLLTGFTKSFIGVDININDSNFASLISYTTSFLNILAVLFIFEGMRIICLAALRGLKDTRIPMFISFIGFWGIAVPVSYLLAFTLHFGGMGLCLGLTIGITANALILLIRFRKLVRKTDLKKLVA